MQKDQSDNSPGDDDGAARADTSGGDGGAVNKTGNTDESGQALSAWDRLSRLSANLPAEPLSESPLGAQPVDSPLSEDPSSAGVRRNTRTRPPPPPVRRRRTVRASAAGDEAVQTDRRKTGLSSGIMAGVLFAKRDRTFWTFQAVGWLGYGFVRAFHGMTIGIPVSEYYPIIIAATFIGVVMSTGMRYVYRLARGFPPQLTFVVAVLVSGGLGLMFSSIETALAPYILSNTPRPVGLARFGNAMFEATVLFAWTAIYFGYHYYQSFREQQEQALKATAMAHQAQLKMLRYQLNPHFLFNTLNAISTLVLEKAEDEANKMLTKLSSFLRYTLVNQPTQKVTLEQELYALGLYLDIEKVRFADRLQIVYDVDEDASGAMIPSLILQPLIENAIKYAIAPSVDGGTLTICAKISEGRLCMALKDDGPGLDDPENIKSKSGSGVGLANTKDRLAQIYGADHSLRLENLEPSGLGVFMEIPCERERLIRRATS